jgi:hypothetical protein
MSVTRASKITITPAASLGAAVTDTDAAITALAARVGATVAAPAALTSAASVGAPTKVEFDKVVVDLAALRTTVAALRTSLINAGLIAS